MTVDEYRTLALSLPDATEGAHMGHPDFRVQGKIFATLAYQDKGLGMVKLRPDQQAVLVQATAPALIGSFIGYCFGPMIARGPGDSTGHFMGTALIGAAGLGVGILISFFKSISDEH
jgi:hypothetical protein